MVEERYHATTQNRFDPDMSTVNKNIRVEAKLISPPTHTYIYICIFYIKLYITIYIKYIKFYIYTTFIT